MKKIYTLAAKLLPAFVFMLQTLPALSQPVAGCRDPQATNFNPAATINDGSCQYTPTNYAPVVKVNPLNSLLSETSGLQWAGDYLWTFNDGGGAAAIYRIDTISNTILQTVNLAGATNTDWEDIAFDGTYFYIGDFGNNANGARTNLKIYKFPLSSIPDYHTNPTATIAAADVQAMHFTYSDQPDPPVATAGPNQTKWDCEAMIADKGNIHLFSKNWVDLKSTHYVISSPSTGVYVATPVDTLDGGYLVTGADKSPGQEIVVLLGYQAVVPGNHFMHILSDYPVGKYVSGNKRKISLGNASTMGQAEGIAFRNEFYGYISNEQYSILPPKLSSFNISAFVSQYVLPVKLKSFTANKVTDGQRITWAFTEPVSNLELQYSSNSADFTTIKTYKNTNSGSFVNKLVKPLNYYRLAWKNDDGTTQYSNILSVKGNEAGEATNFMLRSDGCLYFTSSGSAGYYSFKLTTTDGKTLAQTSDQPFTTGSCKIVLSKNLKTGLFAYLTVLHNQQETTRLLQVK